MRSIKKRFGSLASARSRVFWKTFLTLSISAAAVRRSGMKTTTVCLFLLAFVTGRVASAQTESTALMRGKVKTDHSIFLEANIHAPPAEVFRLWTTADGVKKFFAPDAKIEPRVDGAYTILFAPKADPEGNSHGSKGAHILKFVPAQELSFEWITFAGDTSLGKNAPPFAPPAQRNASPLPTWVEIKLNSDPSDPNRTHLIFAHYGFGDGELWAQSYQWFGRAWKGVLDQLVASCEKENQS